MNDVKGWACPKLWRYEHDQALRSVRPADRSGLSKQRPNMFWCLTRHAAQRQRDGRGANSNLRQERLHTPTSR
jgi:hypothetical protein